MSTPTSGLRACLVLQIRSVDRIHPEWQHREVGEMVPLSPFYGPKVAAFEPGRAIVLEHWGTFCVEPIDQNSTRVIFRTRAPRGLGGVFYHPLVGELPHFVMERGMLKGIKRRAERNMKAPNGIMDGKVVLVTGGTGGIGKDIAEGLASMGATVVVVGRNRSKGEAAAAEIKARSGNEAVEVTVADLSSQAEIHRLVREFEAHHDRLDVLVNNAGPVRKAVGDRRRD